MKLLKAMHLFFKDNKKDKELLKKLGGKDTFLWYGFLVDLHVFFKFYFVNEELSLFFKKSFKNIKKG